MIKRLEVIKIAPDDPIPELKKLGFISSRYDFRNLATDRWYLAPKNSRSSVPIQVECKDPITGIWLACLVASIEDVISERPCDINAWRSDMSPMDIPTCTNTVHICAPYALSFLLSISDEQEEFAGLKSGTLRDIVKRCRQKI